jgi:protein-disulfide isomerase
MQQVMDEYGKNGKVAWVYRHFPLDSIHSQARTEAAASECANELGGNDAFWKYTDRFFELTPSNNQTNIATVLPQIAREIGLDEAKFNSCLASKKYDKHIQNDLDNATATGGNGTPWSIVVTASGKKYPLSGAQPYEAVKQLIELALKEK